MQKIKQVLSVLKANSLRIVVGVILAALLFAVSILYIEVNRQRQLVNMIYSWPITVSNKDGVVTEATISLPNEILGLINKELRNATSTKVVGPKTEKASQ